MDDDIEGMLQQIREAIDRCDYSPKPAEKEFLELVEQEWEREESLTIEQKQELDRIWYKAKGIPAHKQYDDDGIDWLYELRD